MRRDLHVLLARAADDGVDLIRRHDQQASRFMRVAIGREQGGATRAERAVDIHFDAPHFNGALPVRAALQDDLTIIWRQINICTERQLAIGGELLEQLRFRQRSAHIVHAGPAARGVDARALQQCVALHGGARRREHALHQAHGVIDQHARGSPRSVAFDAAAGWVRGVVIDPRELERCAVDHSGMAIDAAEQNGPI